MVDMNNVSQILQQYIDSGNSGQIYSIDDLFAIVVNPSFAIMPNHPYHCPLAVAIYCTKGRGKGRVNTKLFDIEQNGFMIVLPNQITELVNLSSDFMATYVIMSEQFTQTLGIGNTFNLNTIISHNPYITLQDRAKEAVESYITMCQGLIPEQRNPNRVEILRLLTKA